MTQTICPQCQMYFDCKGCTVSDTNNVACWCLSYPPILNCKSTAILNQTIAKKTGDAFQVTTGCMCENCLKKITKTAINNNIDNIPIHLTVPAIALGCKALPLIEGLDYDIVQGKYVFSRWFLLRQGKCCGNSCKNCPYGHINVKK